MLFACLWIGTGALPKIDGEDTNDFWLLSFQAHNEDSTVCFNCSLSAACSPLNLFSCPSLHYHRLGPEMFPIRYDDEFSFPPNAVLQPSQAVYQDKV